jgi:hypothetical protein
MNSEIRISPSAVTDYLQSRRRWLRWRDWAAGRRYLPTRLADRATPVFVVAHSFRDARTARQVSLAIEQSWVMAPEICREDYEDVLGSAPDIMVIQLRRTNRCGCLGHRHPLVWEAPFAQPHDALGGVAVGEMDLAYKPVEMWLALPLSDTALDSQFVEGSRLEEFRRNRLRLKLLSVILHETHHLVSPRQPESSIRQQSLRFYHDALSAYVESAAATLCFTIDRSFHRFG